jgi:uncharacterized protein YbjQ (UPF0145 family)
MPRNNRTRRMNNMPVNQMGGGWIFDTNLDHIMLTTTPDYDMNMYKPAGMVVANRVETISYARGMLAEAPGAFGGKSSLITNAVESLTESAMKDLRKKARAKFKKISAIVGVDVKVSTTSRSSGEKYTEYMIATATGTVLVPIEESVKSLSKK